MKRMISLLLTLALCLSMMSMAGPVLAQESMGVDEGVSEPIAPEAIAPNPIEPEAVPTEPAVPKTYVVAGTAGLCGVAWIPGAEENAMTQGADGIWEKEYPEVSAGEHQFKVTIGSWIESWGNPSGMDGNVVFTTTATGPVTIRFDAEAKVITLITVDGTWEYDCLYGGTGDPTVPVTLELTAQGEQTPGLTLTGTPQELCFDEVLPGTYRLRLSKAGYVPRTLTVTVSNLGETTLETQLNRPGDINGDGRANVVDAAKAYAHAKKAVTLTDYDFLCADTNNDGKVNVLDTAKIYAHAKKAAMLW